MAFQIRFESETGATYITEKGPFLVMYHPLMLIPVPLSWIPDHMSESTEHEQENDKRYLARTGDKKLVQYALATAYVNADMGLLHQTSGISFCH